MSGQGSPPPMIAAPPPAAAPALPQAPAGASGYVDVGGAPLDSAQFKPVFVVDGSGQFGEVYSKDLGTVLSTGGRVANPEDAAHSTQLSNAGLQQKEDVANLDEATGGFGLGAPLAAGLGLFKAGTQGLGPVALGKVAGMFGGDAAERGYKDLYNTAERAHPIATGIGETVGLAAGALAGGAEAGAGAGIGTRAASAALRYSPAGLVGRLGGAAGEAVGGLGSKALSQYATGAVENAIFGTAQQATNDYLGNRDQSFDRLAYAGLLSGGLGGALHVGISAGMGAFAKAAPGIGSWAEKALGKEATSVADPAIKSFDEAASKIGVESTAKTPEELLSFGKKIRGESSSELGNAIKDNRDLDIGMSKGEILDALKKDAVSQGGLDPAKVEKIAGREFKERFESVKKVDPFELREFQEKSFRPSTEPKLESIPEFKEPNGVDTETRAQLRNNHDSANRVTMERNAEKFRVFDEAEASRLKDHTDTQAAAKEAHGREQSEWLEAHNKYQEHLAGPKQDTITAKELWSARSKIDVKNGGPEAAFVKNRLTNLGAGKIADAYAAKGLTSEAGSLTKNLQKYNLSDAAFDAANRVPKEFWGKGAAKKGEASKFAFNPSTWTLASLITGHPKAAVMSMLYRFGKGAAKDVATAAIGKVIPSMEAGMAVKKAMLDASNDLTSNARKFVSATAAPIAQKWVKQDNSRKEYDGQIAKWKEIASGSHPLVTAMSNVDPELGKVAEQKTQMMATNIINKAQSVAPPVYPSGAAGKRIEAKGLSPDEMGVMRYIQAAEEPSLLLRQARSNMLSQDAVDGVKQNHPELYDDIIKQVMTMLTANNSTGKGKAMPMSKRTQLAMLVGGPVDYTTDPKYISAIQESFQPAPKEGGAQAPKTPPADQEYSTESEKIEGK